MKITFVNSAWTGSWGGGEKWTVEAADWFHERGDNVRVVGRRQSKLIAAAVGRGLPVREHRFGGDFDPLAILRARDVLKESRPDIVVVNFNKEAWHFGLAAKRLKVPVVARHGFPLLRDTVHHRQLVANLLAGLVVNAESIRERYADLHYDVSDVPVIHNGVKTLPRRKGELRERFSIPADAPLIVAAGRVEPQKRLDRVIEIAESLLATHSALQVLIAGEGPLRTGLENVVIERGMSSHVHFTGFVPDLSALIGDADLFLLTSDEEGTPNVLLEAMAARVACVAFAVGAVPEILGGELQANAIPAGDSHRMMARVATLLSDGERRVRVANQMYTLAQTSFTFERSMLQFAEWFERTVRSKR